MDGDGESLKTRPAPWFDGSVLILNKIEEDGVSSKELLDAYMAMIPKADGAGALPGQRSPVLCYWLTTGFGPLLNLLFFASGSRFLNLF